MNEHRKICPVMSFRQKVNYDATYTFCCEDCAWHGADGCRKITALERIAKALECRNDME